VCGRRSQLTLFCAHSASGPGSNGALASAAGVGPILTANLMALAPHNYEVGHAIATRKGEPWRDRSHLFRRGKVCNEPRTQAQAASTESFGMGDATPEPT